MIKFKVGNYRSIEGIQEFNMLRGNTRSLSDHVIEQGNVNVLKNAVIFGANASGKSAFVDAIGVSQRAIMSSLNSIPNIRKSYCRVDPDNRSKPSYFEYIFSTKGRYYSYGFEAILSEVRIVSEWLIRLDDLLQGKDELFVREGDEYRFGTFAESASSRLRIYSDDMKGKNHVLFLADMKYKNIDRDSEIGVFQDVIDWFVSKLMVRSKKMPVKKAILGAAPILNAMDTDISEIISRDINQNDTGLDAERINEIEAYLHISSEQGVNEFIDPNRWVVFELKDDILSASKICTVHDSTDSDFDVIEESEGTRNALHMSPILTETEDDMTYIMDEFGCHLHPLLTYKFTELFQERNRDRSCQLIVATHEVLLMTLHLLRRDEIWFVDKKDGRTSLYSLEEFKERFDRNLSKAYMEGMYGALPVFTEVKWGE